MIKSRTLCCCRGSSSCCSCSCAGSPGCSRRESRSVVADICFCLTKMISSRPFLAGTTVVSRPPRASESAGTRPSYLNVQRKEGTRARRERNNKKVNKRTFFYFFPLNKTPPSSSLSLLLNEQQKASKQVNRKSLCGLDRGPQDISQSDDLFFVWEGRGREREEEREGESGKSERA